jgi:hypothetical protein
MQYSVHHVVGDAFIILYRLCGVILCFIEQFETIFLC